MFFGRSIHFSMIVAVTITFTVSAAITTALTVIAFLIRSSSRAGLVLVRGRTPVIMPFVR